jgi:cyclase
MSHRVEGGRFAPPETAVEVSDGIFAYAQPNGSWYINNTGFIVGSRGVVSVDASSTVDRTRAFLAAIAKVTGAPVRTLINTHHHGDHTYGNFLFEGATIVGREGIRELIMQFGGPEALPPVWDEVDWGDVTLAPPFLTFTDEVKVYADDLECQVTYVGAPAHTTNDSIVWIPERRVLFSGDLLFSGGTPFLLQGSITGSLKALERLSALGAETIVPGHGPVCGPEVIDTVTSYLQFVQKVAAQGMDAGLTPLELARDTDLGDFGELLDSERIVGNLYRAYADLHAGMNGTQLGAPIDAVGALADMVAYNGGKPLSCYA